MSKQIKTSLKDLIKGLFAMFKMQKEMFEDEPELEKLVNSLVLEFTNDENYLYVYLSAPYKDFEWLLLTLISYDDDEEFEGNEFAEFYRINTYKREITCKSCNRMCSS